MYQNESTLCVDINAIVSTVRSLLRSGEIYRLEGPLFAPEGHMLDGNVMFSFADNHHVFYSYFNNLIH